MAFIKKIRKDGRTYLIEVQSYRDEKGKVRHKYLRYVGRLEGGKIIEPKYRRIEITRVFPCGIPQMVTTFDRAYRLELPPELLCLASMHLTQPSSLSAVRRNFHRFGLDTYFGELSISGLHRSLDMSEGEIYRKELSLYEKFRRRSSAIFYDITAVYFYGVACSLAMRGYNSQRKLLPQVKIGLATDREGLPIFHKLFRGHTHDGSTLKLFLSCLENAKIRRSTLVLDRSFFSAENVQLIKASPYHAILGVPLKGRLKSMARLEKARKVVLLKSTYLYVRKLRWKGGKLLLCYNEKKAVQMKNRLLRRKGKIDTKLLGWYGIYSTDPSLGAEEIAMRYFERDLIEKSFRSLKSVLGLGPLRHWLEDKINGHLFVCCLAYLFLVLLQRQAKKLDLSTLAALDELKHVYRVVTADGVERVVATTKVQKKLLKYLENL